MQYFPFSLTSENLYIYLNLTLAPDFAASPLPKGKNKYSEVNHMEKEFSKSNEFRKKYYLSEFELFNGEEFITFNIIDINIQRKEITVAVIDRGKINVIIYDLKCDGDRFISSTVLCSTKLK
jgi:hypothetical protein